MIKDGKIILGIFSLFAGFFVLALNLNEKINLIIGLLLAAVGVYLIISNIK